MNLGQQLARRNSEVAPIAKGTVFVNVGPRGGVGSLKTHAVSYQDQQFVVAYCGAGAYCPDANESDRGKRARILDSAPTCATCAKAL